MSIRIATLDDVDHILSMAQKFIEVTNYKNFSDEETLRNLIQNLILSPASQSIILLADDYGMLAGIIAQFPFGQHKVASEIAWWIDPQNRGNGAGVALLDAFEYWANLNGCSMITMVSIGGEIGKFYESKGYQVRETTYVKENN